MSKGNGLPSWGSEQGIVAADKFFSENFCQKDKIKADFEFGKIIQTVIGCCKISFSQTQEQVSSWPIREQ